MPKQSNSHKALIVLELERYIMSALARVTPIFSRFDKQSKLQFSLLTFSTLTSPKQQRFSFSVMASATKKVLVPIAHGSEALEALAPVDVLRRAGADVTVASVEDELQVVSDTNIKTVADVFLKDCVDLEFDLISVPGGVPGAFTLRDCKTLENMVKKHEADGRLYGGICCAPAVVLGSWGLLKGKKATCYPHFKDLLETVADATENRIQHDEKVVTSRGPGTAVEYGVALVEQLLGKEKADEVAGPLVLRSNPLEEHVFTEINPVDWTYDGFPKVLVPIANGTEEIEALSIIDALRGAAIHLKKKIEVVVASVEDKLEVVASRKVKIVADVLLDEAAKHSYDLIVLPGGLGGAQAFANSNKLVDMLKKQKESNKPYGAICASPALVLEPHGLLKGKKATAFPALCNKLSDPSEAENRVLVDGNLITSRGPGTAMEFACVIVEKFFGREIGIKSAQVMHFIPGEWRTDA